MTILERVLAYNWTQEFYILGMIFFFVALYIGGSYWNRTKATTWIEKHKEMLGQQFHQLGIDSKGKLYYSDEPKEFITYATGRQNIDSFKATLTLPARHTFMQYIIELIVSFFFESVPTPQEHIQIILTPNKSAEFDNFIFAIVSKEVMTKARNENYYLSLTKTTDSSKLPINFVFMSEAAEITDLLFDVNSKFKEVFDSNNSVLNYISITDQNNEKPDSIESLTSNRKIIIDLKFPNNSTEYEESIKLIDGSINFVDFIIEKAHFRNDILKKIKSTRQVEINKIQKLLDEQKQEELSEKKAEELKLKKKELSKLSSSEQRKIEQKRREKEQRKQRNKQQKRVR